MPRNLVLVVADTLRAKNLSIYNTESETETPFLKEMSKEYYSVENYYSNSPWTVPAHATIFTGQLPSEHKVTTQNTYFNKKNRLAENLREQGFRVKGISENNLVSKQLGFNEGFDEFTDPSNFIEGAESWNDVWSKDSQYHSSKQKYIDFLKKVVLRQDISSLRAATSYLARKFRPEDAEKYNALDSLETIEKGLKSLNNGEKSFLFLNLMPTHAPYTFEEEQKTKYLEDLDEKEVLDVTSFDMFEEYIESDFEIENLFKKREEAYNASITYLDSLIEKIYSGAPEDTVFVFVGDHGELFGEYDVEDMSLVNHHFGTFKELIQVPLIVYAKNTELNLEKKKGLMDHRDLFNLLISISKDERAVLCNRDLIQSEYFGKAGFNNQFNIPIPDNYEKLFKRKSFSLINQNYKYDLTSDGENLYQKDGFSESEELEGSTIPEKLRKKAEVLYRWRVD